MGIAIIDSTYALGGMFVLQSQFVSARCAFGGAYAAYNHIGGRSLHPVVVKKTLAAHLCIGIHQEEVVKLGFCEQPVADKGSATVVLHTDIARVVETFHHFITGNDGGVATGIIGNDDFVVECRDTKLGLQLFTLLMEVGDQA